MKMVLVFILVIGLFACRAKRQTQNKKLETIHFSDLRIQYEGRVAFTKDASELYWSGSSATIRFRGTAVKAVLSDYNGQNYFAVIVDGKYSGKINIERARKEYVLAENLHYGEHTVKIFKVTQINKEYGRGYIKLYDFSVYGHVLNPEKLPKRKIEFYGNSITCGHAMEDTSGKDSGASIFENNYFSYAAITARHFKAQYHCIAESGIGLMAGFRKEIMPEIYDLVNPFDSLSIWDFNKYIPDLVVVNLLQNDEAVFGQPQSDAFKRRFGDKRPSEQDIIQAYQNFIQKIRGHYPKAYIICVLGNMNITQSGSPWPGYVNKAVENINDKKIVTHFFTYKGTPKHPLVKDHEAMARSLISFIDYNIKW